MLSQKNRDKICRSGLYQHEPVAEWRSAIYADNLYWCFNWTFTPYYNKETNTWYMVDTYFNEKQIELTDENFDGFTLLFDFNDVVQVKEGFPFEDYNESDYYLRIPVDSGGTTFAKHYIKKHARKCKDRVIARYQNEIKSLEHQIEWRKNTLQKIENDEIDIDDV